MARRQTGEYLYIDGEGDYFYGHITLEEAGQSWEEEGLGVARDMIGKLNHTHMRFIPADGDLELIESRPGRGAFPVTVVS